MVKPEPHPSLDGAGRKLKLLGDLGVGEPAEVGELDHLALIVGQVLQRVPHLGGVVAPLHLALGASAAAIRSAAPSSLTSRLVRTESRRKRSIARLWTTPRIQERTLPAAAVIAGAAAPQRQERLLDDVLGHRAPPAHPVGERERDVGMPVEDDLEGLGVARLHPAHQVLVGEAEKVGAG